MDRETLLRRAVKLAALAESQASMEEAEAAGEALARLLQEHRLSMADVTAAQMESRIRAEDHQTEWKRDLPKWANVLAGGIMRATDTKVLSVQRWTAPGTVLIIRFIGEEADAAVACYWFDVLTRLLPKIAEKARPQVERDHIRRVALLGGRPHPWRMLRESFLVGAADRLIERLTATLKPPMPVAEDTGRGLAVMKDAAIAAWIQTNLTNVQDAKKRAPIKIAPGAYQDGMAAADGVTLAAGINRTSGTSPSLGMTR